MSKMLKDNCGENEEGCVIEQLLKTNFINRNDNEKYNIIKSGRPTPALPNLKCKTTVSGKSTTRTFRIIHYDKHTWMTGCPKINKLFCWPCLLYGNKKFHKWIDQGFTDLNNLSSGTTKHEKAPHHFSAVLFWKNCTMEYTQRNKIIDEQERILINTHNENVKRNRLLLRRFIDAICYLGMQGLEFSGHDRNYIEIMEVLRQYDVLLIQHSDEFAWLKQISKEDLISSIAYVLHREIINEIKEAPFIAIILDASHKSKISTMFRIVLKTGEVTERFFELFDISNDKSSEAITNHVIDIINVLKCGEKCIAQSYDDTSVMSGRLNGIPAELMEKFPNAKHVHTSNFGLSTSMDSIAECKVFFATLTAISTFFKNSKKRIDALDIIVKRRHSEISEKLLNFDSDVVCLVYNYRDSLKELFQTIISEPQNWHALSIQSSRSFVHFFEDFLTQFLLKVFNSIYEYTDVLFDVLQNIKFDISYCIGSIEETLKNVKEIRNRFDEFYEETIAPVDDPPQKKQRCNTEIDIKCIFFKIIETTLIQLELRYRYYKELVFIDLLDSKKFNIYSSKIPQHLLSSLKTSHAQFFNMPKLINELNIIYNTETFYKFSVEAFAEHLVTYDLKSTFTEVYKLIALILTLPIYTSSCSTLHRIKHYLSNTISENTVSDLILIYIESKVLKRLQTTEEFYTEVVVHFAEKTNRKEFIEMDL